MKSLKQSLVYITAVLNLINFGFCDLSEDGELRLVTAIFRHGSRTQDSRETYPLDPYTVKDFRPPAYGQLTNQGKRQAYNLGKLLHAKYENFLDENRTLDSVYVQATAFQRTRMTALLVLAGLLPPTPTDRWSDELNWIPIPCNYEDLERDYILWKPHNTCPAFSKELRRVKSSEEHLKILEDNVETLRYIEQHAGLQIRSIQDAFKIHQTLDTEWTMNLSLPKWTESVFPKTLKQLAVQKLLTESQTPLLKRLNGGRILKLIAENLKKKSDGTLTPSDRKMFLYGGHEITLATPMINLGIFENEFPQYASALLIELYHMRATNDFRVKVSYIRGANYDAEDRIIPGCDLMCPLDQFLGIIQPYLPGNLTEECESTVSMN